MHLVLRHVEVALNGVKGEVRHAVRLLRQLDLIEHIRLGSTPKPGRPRPDATRSSALPSLTGNHHTYHWKSLSHDCSIRHQTALARPAIESHTCAM